MSICVIKCVIYRTNLFFSHQSVTIIPFFIYLDTLLQVYILFRSCWTLKKNRCQLTCRLVNSSSNRSKEYNYKSSDLPKIKELSLEYTFPSTGGRGVQRPHGVHAGQAGEGDEGPGGETQVHTSIQK